MRLKFAQPQVWKAPRSSPRPARAGCPFLGPCPKWTAGGDNDPKIQKQNKPENGVVGVSTAKGFRKVIICLVFADKQNPTILKSPPQIWRLWRPISQSRKQTCGPWSPFSQPPPEVLGGSKPPSPPKISLSPAHLLQVFAVRNFTQEPTTPLNTYPTWPPYTPQFNDSSGGRYVFCCCCCWGGGGGVRGGLMWNPDVRLREKLRLRLRTRRRRRNRRAPEAPAEGCKDVADKEPQHDVQRRGTVNDEHGADGELGAGRVPACKDRQETDPVLRRTLRDWRALKLAGLNVHRRCVAGEGGHLDGVRPFRLLLQGCHGCGGLLWISDWGRPGSAPATCKADKRTRRYNGRKPSLTVCAVQHRTHIRFSQCLSLELHLFTFWGGGGGA